MVSYSAAALPRNSLAKVADPIGCPRCLQPVVISWVSEARSRRRVGGRVAASGWDGRYRPARVIARRDL